MKITLLKSLLITGALLCFGMARAQEVTGTVSDSNGPLPGASVVVKGTTNGTQTDFDGNFTLSVESDATLIVSYIGYLTKEVRVSGQSTINVTLQEDAEALEEVVVIGYGTTSVKDATGAVDVVNAKDFNGGIIASPEQLLQGKSAGVQITEASGEPGAGVNIRIRGTSSVRSNNNPLFVVDGVPLSGGATGGRIEGGSGSAAPANPLNFINPNDIASISILKDASATAIYGSRGANGVVIITTKSGKGSAGGQLEWSSNVSVATPASRFDLLNRREYLDAITSFGGNAAVSDFGNETDWQDEVTRTVASQNQNVSYSNSYKNGSVRASLGYGKQFGVVENSALERLTGRVNLTHNLFNDKLTLNVQATISNVIQDGTAISDNAGFQGDLLGAAYKANPTIAPSNAIRFPGGANLNPAQLRDFVFNETVTNRALINFSANYKITDELSAKVNLGYDNSVAEGTQAWSSRIDNLNGVSGNGTGYLEDRTNTNPLMEITLNYEKEFENSKLSVLGGYSYQEFQSSGNSVRGWGFSTTDLNQMARNLRDSEAILANAAGAGYQNYGFDNDGFFATQLFPTPSVNDLTAPSGINVNSVSSNTFDNSLELQSFFGRINYSIADKYLLTGTVRADGSSSFGGNNQYGIFPSGAFAWQLSEEDFIPEAFSTLKLRLGYGITGNQDGLGYGNFIRRERYGNIGPDAGGNINPPGIQTVAFANPDLKWESTSQANIGLDFGFGNDRFNGSLDFYRRDTKDFLLQNEAAQPSPQPFFFENVDANIINTGVEVALNYDIIQSDNANWNFGVNVAYNDNVVKNFDGLIPFGQIFGQGLTGAFSQLLAEGQPLFSFYLREFIGYDENGQQEYANGDVQSFVGKSALPNLNVGINTSFNYKNFDFSAAMAGQFGHYIYNNTANALFTAGSINSSQNVTSDVIGNGEAANNAPDVATRFLESGDFLRLQNAVIGYNINLSGEGLFKSLRLSLTGQNLFVITDYTGLDPEVNTSNTLNNVPSLGIDYTAFPRPRTYTFGLNATF